MKPGWLLTAGGLSLALCALACGRTSPEGPAPLRVFAAASTTDILTRVSAEFRAAPVTTHFGPTSGLARQIVDGAPADVFVAASKAWVDYLDQRACLAGPAGVFCTGQLVCIAPLEGEPSLREARDLEQLLARLPAGARVAIASEGVPAGDYVRQSLGASELLVAFSPCLIAQLDARAVLRAVEAAEVDAGFVYATDARGAPVRVLFALDPTTHSPIEYYAAVLQACPDPVLATRFVEALHASETRELLSQAGFGLPARAPGGR